MKTRSIRTQSAFVAFGLLIGLGTTVVRADWDPTQPAKWFQLPDLNNGMDVLDTFNPQLPHNKILADDFLCTQSGPITDVHIWGSWLNDKVPVDASGLLSPPLFHLSIHSDIPATPGTSYSQPGQELWSMNVLPSQMRIYATGNERFYDPNLGQIIGFDTQVWQYNFDLPAALAFQQQQGTIYWLDVQVMPQPPGDATGPFLFGWKTSFQHFNDDAVFGDNTTFGGPPAFWRDLHDPASGQSLDMAFALTTVPEPGTGLLVFLGGGLLLLLKQRARGARQ